LGLRDGKCPLCGSKLTLSEFEDHLRHVSEEIRQQNVTLSALAREEAEAANGYSKAKNEFDAKTLEIKRAASESETLKQKSLRLQREADELQTELSEEGIAESLKFRRDQLKELEKDMESFEAYAKVGQMVELEDQRQIAQSEADRLGKRIELVTNALQGAKAAAAAAKRVSREIVEERLAALNPLLSELYTRLRPHVAYDEVKYRMRGDVRRFLRLEVGDDINPRFTFSSGQRRALGLAFLLAVHLSRPWCKLKTLILDDPVQHIDDYRALHLAEVLSAIRQLGSQVICTVEDPALADLLCRRLRSTESEDGVLVRMGYKAGMGVQIEEVRHLAPLPGQVLLSA
jgi:chromosome segregation protein